VQTLQDYAIIFPDDSDGAPPVDGANNGGRTFDGTWELYANVPSGATSFELWDGDFDRGGDTDDPNSAGVPMFNVDPMSQAEGARPVGLPNDDFGSGSYRNVPPNVSYTAFSPTDVAFANGDPSGNSEWELFRVGANGVANSDYNVAQATLEAGPWNVSVQGVDINNLNAVYYAGSGLAACETGTVLSAQAGGMSGLVMLPNAESDTAAIGREVVLSGVTASGETIRVSSTATPVGVGRAWFSFSGLPAGRYYLSTGDASDYPMLVHLAPGEEKTDVLFAPVKRSTKPTHVGPTRPARPASRE
jgi:hypothetical protein